MRHRRNARLPEVSAAEPRRLILNERNDGFARACNQERAARRHPFLNNDTVLARLSRPAPIRGGRTLVGVNAVTNRIGTEAEVSERARTLGDP
jgi:hypothetical protein